ncbi:peptidase inhibitor i9 domain-containing protein [Rhizoctonia solani AG-1 IA]|uniref:Peptidase inhibitor i9 domain-containing protein n=1 Tax=Thanatephorus cucumeris (strain AG1-IA) TaxID=983506 RepID=L8WZC0_THACA|nr:peptidase inhibitor i9 domain-containing protein [Rhizoctonia solani AG-1 IA]
MKYTYEELHGIAFEISSCPASFLHDPIVDTIVPPGLLLIHTNGPAIALGNNQKRVFLVRFRTSIFSRTSLYALCPNRWRLGRTKRLQATAPSPPSLVMVPAKSHSSSDADAGSAADVFRSTRAPGLTITDSASKIPEDFTTHVRSTEPPLPQPHIIRSMKVYIVMFKESATKDQIENYMNRIREDGGKIKYDYSELMKAVAIWVADDLVKSFASDPLVESMELDQVASTQV